MSNKSSFREPFVKQHWKRAKTLLKSERQHIYHISWPLWRQLSFKKCLLEICKMLRLFVNTLTTDDNYSLLNRDNLTQPIQTQLPQKQNIFLKFSHHFWNIVSIWNIFKKKMTFFGDAFPKYLTPKNKLDQCLITPVSGATSKSNIVNWLKHCRNLNDRTVAIFIDHCGGNWLLKSLC